MRVLLVEDDVITARFTTTVLAAEKIVVHQADTGGEAVQLTRIYEYDLVVLDLMLPDMDGYDVVRRMRHANIDTPVLMLSGLPQSQATVKGLGLGADDFIAKPFDNGELLARVHAVVRRSRGFNQAMLRVGNIAIDPLSREVSVDGTDVPLTGREYAILELLVRGKGKVVTTDALLSHLYIDTDEPKKRIISVFICRLRKKLARGGAEVVIATVSGLGFIIRNTAPRNRIIEAEIEVEPPRSAA